MSTHVKYDEFGNRIVDVSDLIIQALIITNQFFSDIEDYDVKDYKRYFQRTFLDLIRDSKTFRSVYTFCASRFDNNTVKFIADAIKGAPIILINTQDVEGGQYLQSVQSLKRKKSVRNIVRFADKSKFLDFDAHSIYFANP